ncbi:hypothetical protein SK128_014344 [Halocaridina rubra]|uniref:Aldehyde oxidase/xanthine dehydrogenase second molybdopterin binding domain-containing protein n=1 Tax=Halocaridina rubra TaxID=373956 RepID=A0AAN8WSY7_HALRR
MDHIAHYLQKDPLKVRELNLVPANVPRLNVPPHDKNVVQEDILPLLKEKASILQRKGEVEEFNKKNRWKKRGLSVVPMWHGIIYYPPFKYGMFVVIYERDGTVAISHGGIEMGQGLNTKVAQVAAYTLGIPLEKVVVKASDTMMGANSAMSGASLVTDLCCQGVKKSCEKLKQRLDVIKAKMGEDGSKEPSWEELTQRAYSENVDLSERCWVAGEEVPEDYDVWGATCLEVELDILTGEYMIKRVDLIEDCGRSLNPYVDIGQVEGAFVMGLGLFTSEVIKFNPNTGQKLSDGTWEYKPPTASDIPRDFRITLLPNAKHPRGVLGSKAIGEPPLIMSYAVVSALRQAISSFRASNGDTEWFVMDTPITVEKAHQLCEVKPEYFQF